MPCSDDQTIVTCGGEGGGVGVLERRDRERRGFPARPREARPDSPVLSRGFGRDNGLPNAILFRPEKIGPEVILPGDWARIPPGYRATKGGLKSFILDMETMCVLGTVHALLRRSDHCHLCD
jgi:hypothetical protein